MRTFYKIIIPSFLLMHFLLSTVSTFGQNASMNMNFFSSLTFPNLPERQGGFFNDIWGYTASNGQEIAILGGIEDIFFIDVTQPANPVLIHEHHVVNPGNGSDNASVWRDFKVYGSHVYAVADEGAAGLLIFDMSNAPEEVTLVTQTTSFFNRTHNIYIDELNGRLYAAGSNSVPNGLVILNLAGNPANPTLLSNLSLNTYGGGYCHDVYVNDNIAYCSHGSLSKLQAYDLNNLNDVEVVGVVDMYPEPGYNHSSWVSEDLSFLIMADETHGSDLKYVDMTDPLDISSDDIETFYSELEGAGAPGSSIAHNPFIIGNLVYISYYHDGVQVFDVSDRNNITRVAYYDTYPENTGYGGYEGCWGVYPYFNSGHIIASDITHGLMVMEIIEMPLPIDFISFEAERNKSNVDLKWVVDNVSNGDKFEVMRSSDGGETFSSIGQVAYYDGQQNYQFTDATTLTYLSYQYRIDFIENDQRRINSSIENVKPQSDGELVKIINPVSDEFGVLVYAELPFLEMELYSMEGKLIFSAREVNANGKISFARPTVSNGSYVLKLKWPGEEREMIVNLIN